METVTAQYICVKYVCEFFEHLVIFICFIPT